MLKLAVAHFTENGQKIANKILLEYDAEFLIYDKKNQSLGDFVKASFESYDGIIFVGAVGIAVRGIAPYIKSKDKDPAVIVIDEKGRYVIPILSGHLGGANKLAEGLALLLRAESVITTATDINGKFAVDVWSGEHGCVIGDISKIKHISSAILRGESVFIHSDLSDFDRYFDLIPNGLTLGECGKVGIMLSLNDKKSPFEITLNLIPQIVTVGVGCKRNTDIAAFEEFILQSLSELCISIKAVKAIASIELKKDEQCIIKFCEKYNLPFITYSADKLSAVEGEFTSSEFVKRTTGVDNVCERGAVCGGGRLIKTKLAQNGMTIAVGIDAERN